MDKRDFYLKLLWELREKKVLEQDDIQMIYSSILEWFKYFQWDEDPNKMLKLYQMLLREEAEEGERAWLKEDIREVLDAIIDYIWVRIGYDYFFNIDYDTNDVEEVVLDAMSALIPYQLLHRALLEVSYSNWTKSKEKRWDDDPEWKAGKIIKGPDYKAPDWDLVFKKIKEWGNI